MIISLVKDSSFLVLIIMAVLLIMSIYVLYKSILGYGEIIERQIENKNFVEKFHSGDIILTLNDGVKKVTKTEYPNIFNLVVFNYMKLKSKSNEKIKIINEKKIEYENSEFERSFSSIATISSVAPYLGLLGTVIGIMNTFYSISSIGSVSLSHIAPSIGESLIVTALGLFVAIPANIIYNNLTSLTDKVYSFYNVVNEEIYVINTK